MQLWAELRSASQILNGLGCIRASSSPAIRSSAVSQRSCRSTPPGPSDAELVFHEANDHAPPPVPIRFEVQPLPRPDFHLQYRLVNDDSGNSVGNGDGQPKRGEAIDVAVALRNLT